MHFRELSLTSNTARLAEIAIRDCEIRVRGRRDRPVDAHDLVGDPRSLPLLLYPSEDAAELGPEHSERARRLGRRIVLLVPDGNWRQGGKAARRTPGLADVECVKLPPGPPSEYGPLRTAPRPECVSTFEAIARSLGILEGKEVEDRLMGYFRVKLDRTLWARGILPTERVRGGVPQAAIDSFSIAGARGSPRPVAIPDEFGYDRGSMPASASVLKKKISPYPELDELAERVGEFIQYWGFKRIHGKIWAHLYLSEVPLDATTLVKRLRVSKALVSFSIHDLLEYNVIRQVARGRGRTVLYEANPDLTGIILNVLRLRERKMVTRIMGAAELLGRATPEMMDGMKVSPRKLSEMREMIASAQSVLDFVIGSGAESRDLFLAFQAMVAMKGGRAFE
jgi:DTW domain-containing protein YfiP/DNA-binding transcriptional regulator GbsR (MarR family)